MALLTEHCVSGRLTTDELVERIGEAYSARTLDELRRVMRDLPALREASPERALARKVAAHVRDGWRVESQSSYQAVVVRGNRPNHLLHGVLTACTGVWGIVWLAVALSSVVERRLIELDDRGEVRVQRVP